MTKVDQLFRMTDSPCSPAAALMTVIRSGDRIAANQGIDHGLISNGAGPTTVPNLKIFSIPAGGRLTTPQFEFQNLSSDESLP